MLQTMDLDRGCFACMRGGTDKRTVFLIIAEWRGMDQILEMARAGTGQVLTMRHPHVVSGGRSRGQNPPVGVDLKVRRSTPW
jgi:hypothetical protein